MFCAIQISPMTVYELKKTFNVKVSVRITVTALFFALMIQRVEQIITP